MKYLINFTLLFLFITSVTCLIPGCASGDSSQTKRVSTVPWNKPQRWEGQGQMGAIVDAMGSGRPGSY